MDSNGSPGDDVSPVEEADGHVLARPWITFHHLVSGLETGSRDLVHSGGLVVGLPVFVNVKGGQESIPRNLFRQPM